ncbi:unnamed protein product [Brachionus calyciflorus]|uniref:protein kinase C n=1 Tax=Brachionus calyciflorus TaxID=104777 RepID=A0A813NIF4_9BILA|nr:unnamed protein product [Brachionus calyciflorus]
MSAQIDQNYSAQTHPNLSTSLSSSGSTSPNSLIQNNFFSNLTNHPKNDLDIDFSSQLKLNSSKTKIIPSDSNDIKIQVYYCGLIMVVYIKNNLKIEEFYNMLRDICKFDDQQLFTIKWVDEEGDPCTVSSQIELDEALRLYYLNKENELVVHVFANIPERPGTQCAGEDRSIYRRGARRWRKIYLVNGHKYQAKRFARTALCGVCQDRIWGLGRQGYKCLECKIMVHKRCHKFIKLTCSEILVQQQSLHQQQLNSYLSTGSTQSAPSQIQTSNSSHSLNSHVNTALLEDLKQAQKNKIQQKNPEKIDIFQDLQNNVKTSSPIIGKNKSFNAKLSNLLNKNALKTNDNEINVDFSTNKEILNGDKNFHSDSNNCIVSNTKQISLENFDLIKVIGRGSYAKVFLVEYKKTRKCYAMKVIKKSIVNDDEDIDWVQTEKHVFEQATNHPFLVGLHSCFQTESRLFFVIEYLCGGDLMYHMQRKRRLPEDHARFYSAEISVALGFLHSRGIIYRDLKLDNVLLDIEGHVKLTDYGMCKEGLGKGERTSTFCGTPNYIAPEMLRGEDYDFSVDWWALGVLLYEMMAGRSPFEPVNENPGDNPDLNTEDHLFQVILEKPIRIPRSLSVRAASVLKGFLQKQPTERLASHDGLNEVKQHLFFRPIDWNLLEQRMIQPPYKPPVQNERDLNNIDELFTREPVMLTPDTPNTLARIQQNEFDGFEYINPLILSDEIPV